LLRLYDQIDLFPATQAKSAEQARYPLWIGFQIGSILAKQVTNTSRCSVFMQIPL
jgi:hypothetical protein